MRRRRGLTTSPAEVPLPFCTLGITPPALPCPLFRVAHYVLYLYVSFRSLLTHMQENRDFLQKGGVRGVVFENSLFVICLCPARNSQHARGAYFPVRHPAARAQSSLIAHVCTVYHGARRCAATAQILSAVRNRMDRDGWMSFLMICIVQRCRRTVWLILKSK